LKAKQSKAQYTIEFKQKAIRLVKSGQTAMQGTSTLGMPHQTLDNWLRADRLGKLSGAGERVLLRNKWSWFAYAPRMRDSKWSAIY